MKIAFIGTMTLLDHYSGAALSVRSFLEALAAAGHECWSYTASSFDREEPISLETVFGEGVTIEKYAGEVISHRSNEVEHNVFITSHTHRTKVERDEWIKMLEIGVQFIREEPADLYITFGQNQVTEVLQRTARATGGQLVIYLGNAEHSHKENFEDTDKIVCPSQFLADHYKATLGLDADVVRSVIPQGRYLAPEDRLFVQHPELRKQGFVTFFNPQFTKGVGLVARLVSAMRQRAPDMTFLLVSGREGVDKMRFGGRGLSEQPNVWSVDGRDDVRSLFQRTSIFLLPSAWQEGANRSLVEAQLSGIPVIASQRGGNSERLNGGGFCLDLPERYTKDYRVVPTEEEISAWIDTLLLLWNDEQAYADAAAKALEASVPFQPEQASANAVAYFESLVAQSPAVQAG